MPAYAVKFALAINAVLITQEIQAGFIHYGVHSHSQTFKAG